MQQHTSEEQRADQVIVLITTDGMENSSKEYTVEKIKSMVERQKEKHGWEFIFLGANIDAISTAARYGIDSNRAANFHADGQGARLNFKVPGNFVSELRNNDEVSDSWKADLDEDHARPQKNKK